MRDHCKKLFLSLLLFLLVGTHSLPAASVRWIHLGTIDAGLVSLAIDGKVAYRKMPPGGTSPWGNISAGLHSFQIASEKNSGFSFELEITKNQKITIVSVSDKNGDLQSRTFGVDEPEGEIFVLNMMPGAIMGQPEPSQKVIFGKGFWLPDDKAKNTVSLADGEGFSGEVDFSRLGDKPKDSYLAVIWSNDDGKPNLAVLRDRDSLAETSDESVEIADELLASIRIIAEGRVAVEGSFDPSATNWEEVKSQIFWLNLMIERDPCRLEVSGFPAMRRMPSGRGSGFVKWPAGDWKTDIVVESTNEKLASDNFMLSAKASVGLISSGGGKFPHRLLNLEGRSQEKSGSKKTTQIRFVNALPDGVIRSVVQDDPEPKTITLKPGEVGDIIPLETGKFPGATLDLTLGKAKSKKIARIPAKDSMPAGDWVVVLHLDQESFAAPVLTWIEMDKGTITDPATKESE
jgi:hypothetical protein